MAFEITKELQDTVLKYPHLDKIYIGKNGRWYTSQHKLLSRKPEKDEDESDVSYKMYGEGVPSHYRVIPGELNVDKLREQIAKGFEGSEIVQTLTREEILSANAKQTDDSLATQIFNSSAEEKNQIFAALGFTPEMIAFLKNGPTESKPDKAASATPPPPAPDPKKP